MGGQFRIALVEDHALISLGFRDLIATTDDICIDACVETVAELPEVRLDLVVLDLRLADSSSPADNVSTIVKRGVPVLIYTGAEDRSLIQAAARSGAAGLVRKSAAPEELLDAIRTAASGGSVFSTDWAAAIDSDSELPDAGLSEREAEVLAMYASGETAQTVARALGISRATVSDYVIRIRRKYSLVGRPATSRVDLFRRAIEDGLIE
ncbi:response regulator transcription factor [Demequina sp. B12]|uniref:response regulator transcription factor n=1 Tax=Demequina sp. B12 TaxID=2992757 RepID=UPI00237B32DB|nr:response regulator transcription factor [Demequina sp. B12]MDE0572010.1 response regulator transcription factor [Demequina sp. B12]